MADPELRPQRVYETVLYATDLEATVRFYGEVVGLRQVEALGGLAAVFRLDDGGMLLVFDPARASEPGRQARHGALGPGHLALSVPPGALDAFVRRLGAAGVAVELRAEWPAGGRSVYVRDPAGNSLELIDGEAWPGRPGA